MQDEKPQPTTMHLPLQSGTRCAGLSVCGVTSFTNGGYPEAHSWPFRGRIITSARIYPWASPLSITMLDEIAGDGLGGSGITLVPKVC